MSAPSFLRPGRAALTAIAVLILDQLTKVAAFAWVAAGDEANVLPGVTISQTRNEGIAFGFLSGRPVLVLGLMAAALIVLMWFYRGHRDRPVLWLATGLLLGGALGNAVDRISLGYVRDFVNLPGWPAFNGADTAITFGVVVLVLSIEHRADHEDPAAAVAETGAGDGSRASD